jgi:hypothetical protein
MLMDGKRRNGTPWGCHRVSALLYLDTFDENQQVNHRCGKKDCVNPAHLYVGTHRDNMSDAKRLGEMSHGERHGMATVSDASVSWAKSEYASGRMTQTAIGKRLGVTQACVGYWCRGEYRF